MQTLSYHSVTDYKHSQLQLLCTNPKLPALFANTLNYRYCVQRHSVSGFVCKQIQYWHSVQAHSARNIVHKCTRLRVCFQTHLVAGVVCKQYLNVFANTLSFKLCKHVRFQTMFANTLTVSGILCTHKKQQSATGIVCKHT